MSAPHYLGTCRECGEGVPLSLEEAARWYRLSADQGLDRAQFKLGMFYENGWGVQKSISEAKMWYRKAADQGHEKAKEALKKL